MTQRAYDAMIAIREADSQSAAMTAALAFAQDMFEAGVVTGRASNEGSAWTTEPPTADGFYWYRPTTDNPKQLARLVLVFSYRKQRDALTIDEDDGSTDSWSFENLCAEEPCEWKAARP